MTDEQIKEYLDPKRNPDDHKKALTAALCVPGGGAELWNDWVQAWLSRRGLTIDSPDIYLEFSGISFVDIEDKLPIANGKPILDFQGYLFLYVSFENVTFPFDTNFSKIEFYREADFFNTTFSGDAIFSNATFPKGVDFSKTIFSGDANFSNATSFGHALFSNADFSNADFSGAKFSRGAKFSNASFSEYADFSKAEFSENADFSSAEFSGYANFSNAKFSGNANFSNAKFSEYADFSNATFSGRVNFSKATFSGRVNFSKATFSKAKFSKAKFFGDTQFLNVTFSRDTDFSNAQFSLNTNFYSAKFSGNAEFSNARFSENVNFNNATFSEYADFSGTTFSENIGFSGATFSGYANFSDASFSNVHLYHPYLYSEGDIFDIDFSYAHFSLNANFHKATFLGHPSFYNAKFSEDALFSHTEFPAPMQTNFGNTTFEKNLALDAESFEQVPTFFGTHVKGVIVFPRNILKVFKDTKSNYAQKGYTFLKCHAHKQSDFRAEQAFYVREMDAHAHLSSWGYYLLFSQPFRWVSLYATSPLRSLVSWLVLAVVFGMFNYFSLGESNNWFSHTLQNAFPPARYIVESDPLYNPCWWQMLAAVFHSLLSTLLLLWTALALRNLFRMRQAPPSTQTPGGAPRTPGGVSNPGGSDGT